MNKSINAIEKVKIGDIFAYSWGYDQTNVDFYQVVSKTKKTISIKKIKSKVTETGFMCGDSVPLVGEFKDEKELRKIPYMYDGDTCLKGVYVSMTYGSCELWSGNPERCSWYA